MSAEGTLAINDCDRLLIIELALRVLADALFNVHLNSEDELNEKVQKE